jgi:hypothetical protein
MRLKDRFASKPLDFRLSSDGIESRQGASSALPKLHGRKRGDETFLCPMRVAAAIALPGLRFRERAKGQVLRRVRQADGGAGSSCADIPVAHTTH